MIEVPVLYGYPIATARAASWCLTLPNIYGMNEAAKCPMQGIVVTSLSGKRLRIVPKPYYRLLRGRGQHTDAIPYEFKSIRSRDLLPSLKVVSPKSVEWVSQSTAEIGKI